MPYKTNKFSITVLVPKINNVILNFLFSSLNWDYWITTLYNSIQNNSLYLTPKVKQELKQNPHCKYFMWVLQALSESLTDGGQGKYYEL